MTETQQTADDEMTRSQTSYLSFNERFRTYPPSLTSTPTPAAVQAYNRQYANVYNARLRELKPKCLQSFQQAKEKSAEAADPSSSKECESTATVIVPRIIELQEDTTSLIVGTIIKQCPKKPKINFDTNQMYHEGGLSYLGTPYDDDNENNNDDHDDVVVDVEPSLAKTNTYCDITNDTIVLEDPSGRVELNFAPSKEAWKLELVTGIVVGVKGGINPGSNLFDVHELYYPTIGQHRDVPNNPHTNDDDNPIDNEDACVLLMSGLDCGGYDTKRNSSTSLKRELLIDYITGHLHNNNDHNPNNESSISRVLIAGGGCAKPIRPENASFSWSTTKAKKSKEELQQQMKEMTAPIRELDLFLSEICAYGIPVDYIPGLYDPTNANWPQKPIHECLVPNAQSCTNMLIRSTNPYEASIGGKVFLGSDGLNVSDLRLYLGEKVVNEQEELKEESKKEIDIVTVPNVQALESSLKFNHMVPTGPDSVPTFPFDEKDPFVIHHVPDVYFCGNCEKFETKVVNVKDVKVRLVCIPSFVKTGQVILMNLNSMQCKVIEFDDVVVDSNNDDVRDDNGNVVDEKKTG